MAPISKEVDYLVIGGGSGGIGSARRAASYGAKVMVVESARLGGTCVNVGCMPKKVTWNAAALAETFKDAEAYGFHYKETAPFDWPGFTKKRADFVKRLNGIYETNLNKDKAEYVAGRATFIDGHSMSIKLNDGSQETVRAKHILIAPGGYPTVPSIPGAELGITSDGFFDLYKQPKKAALVGAGYIAIEMAGMLHALGTETHLFIRHDKFLRTFDPMVQDKVLAEYKRQGIIVHTNSKQEKIEDLGDGNKRVHFTDSSGSGTQTLDVDCLLWAIGRTPDLKDLQLDKVGVRTDDKGHIVCDDYQATNVPDIFTLGDACDKGFELTPVAIAAGRKLSDRLFGGKKDAKLQYENIPSVVFAHPEIGSVGLTEPAAREKYGDKNIKTYTTSFTATFYSMLPEDQRSPTSFKVVCAGEDERVVGLHILGAGCSEMLQGFGVALKMGARKQDLDSCVAIHPTSAEELVTLK